MIRINPLPLIFSLLFVMLASANASAQGNVVAKDNSQFIKLLAHEIQNRAFALAAVNQSIEANVGKPEEQMWIAYSALEQLNQKKFQPITEKFGLSQEASFFTKTKALLIGVFARLFPETTINIFKNATTSYVAQLEELEELAASEDKAFFRYVVLQEQAQVQALVLMAEGNAIQAAEILNAFVEEYS